MTHDDAGPFFRRCMRDSISCAQAGVVTWAMHLAHALDTFVPGDEPWIARMAEGANVDVPALQAALHTAWGAHACTRAGTKVRTYFAHMAYSPDGGLPPYLRSCLPHPVICSMARFRLGSHCLRVETDRWGPEPHVARSERRCRRCPSAPGDAPPPVDDEHHMLFTCQDFTCATASLLWGDSLFDIDTGATFSTVRRAMHACIDYNNFARMVHECMTAVDASHEQHSQAARPLGPRRRYVPYDEPLPPRPTLPPSRAIPGAIPTPVASPASSRPASESESLSLPSDSESDS